MSLGERDRVILGLRQSADLGEGELDSGHFGKLGRKP